MQTSPFTPQVLARSVVSVPPLARNADLSLNHEANVKLIRHLEGGGVSTLLYGGNANFYHVSLSEYGKLLAFLVEAAGPETLVVPSVGPAYGTMIDQARVLSEFDFPTVMVLPQQGITTSQGVENGIRQFVEAFGRPAMLYVKHDGYLEVESVRRLFDAGLVSMIKYAVVRENTGHDEYLRRLVNQVDPRHIMSGIGEQPAILHLREFGLGGFTSGCVCVAPKLSMDLLRAAQAERWDEAERIRKIFERLEDLRNQINPIRVLHEAITLAGIGNMGTIQPLLSNLENDHHAAVEEAAKELLAANHR